MSRKRSWSLSSKWKLNKELNDYQQHRQDRKQGGTGYLDEPDLVKHRSKKNAGYCKNLKGEHDYVYQEVTEYSFFPGHIKTYKCSDCGKGKLKFNKGPLDDKKI